MFERLDLFGNKRARLTAIARASMAESLATPDRALLDMRSHVLVFEYGDLKHGFKHHKLMGDEYLTPAVTNERFFVWNCCLGPASYPIASKISGVNAERTRIRGELYMVDTDALYNLDRHRELGVKFKRKFVKVILPIMDIHEHGKPIVVDAMFYYAMEDHWRNLIEFDGQMFRGNGGSQFKPLSANGEDLKRPYLGRYTEFTPQNLHERKVVCPKQSYGAIAPPETVIANGHKPSNPYAEHQRIHAIAVNTHGEGVEFLSYDHATGTWK